MGELKLGPERPRVELGKEFKLGFDTGLAREELALLEFLCNGGFASVLFFTLVVLGFGFGRAVGVGVGRMVSGVRERKLKKKKKKKTSWITVF